MSQIIHGAAVGKRLLESKCDLDVATRKNKTKQRYQPPTRRVYYVRPDVAAVADTSITGNKSPRAKQLVRRIMGRQELCASHGEAHPAISG
jgi:hypothetical protein